MSSVREGKASLLPMPRDLKRKVTGSATEESKENRPGAVKRLKLSSDTPVKAPSNPAIAAIQSHIDLEYKIRDGASKLLQASKTTWQSMEASKGLFVSNAKIIALMKEVQQRQAAAMETKDSNEIEPCQAKIAIGDIRIPLEWREFEHPKNKADSHAKYGVFCLFKIDNQVMDTPTLAEVDRTTMDIVFKDTVIFPEKVGPDFTLEVEVYCSVPEEPTNTKPSTPIKMLKKLRSKDKADEPPTVPSSPYTPHTTSVTPSHRYHLAGHTQLTLKDLSTSTMTYPLKRGSVGASGTAATSDSNSPLLPLWGQLCCKLVAQPDCATEPRTTGFINVHRMVGGLRDWKRLWCVMRQQHLRCWNFPEDVGRKMPQYTADLISDMVVDCAPRLAMRRPNSLLITNPQGREMYLAFESREEQLQWMECIKQAILDLKVWGTYCNFTISTPQSKFFAESPTKEFSSLPEFAVPANNPPSSALAEATPTVVGTMPTLSKVTPVVATPTAATAPPTSKSAKPAIFNAEKETLL